MKKILAIVTMILSIHAYGQSTLPISGWPRWPLSVNLDDSAVFNFSGDTAHGHAINRTYKANFRQLGSYLTAGGYGANLYNLNGTITGTRTATVTGNLLFSSGNTAIMYKDSALTDGTYFFRGAGIGSWGGFAGYYDGTPLGQSKHIGILGKLNSYHLKVDTTFLEMHTPGAYVGFTDAGIDVNGDYSISNAAGSAGNVLTLDSSNVARWAAPTGGGGYWTKDTTSLHPIDSSAVSVDVYDFSSTAHNGDIVNSATGVGGGAPFTGVRRLVDGAYMLNGVLNLVPFGADPQDTAISVSGYLNTSNGVAYGFSVKRADSAVILRSEKGISISADMDINITSAKGNLLLEAPQANIIIGAVNVTRNSIIGNNGVGAVVSNFLFNTCSIDSNDIDSTSEFGYSIMWDNVHARHNTLHNGAQDWHIDGKEFSFYTNNKTIGTSRRDVIGMINHDEYSNDVVIGNGGLTENMMLHGYCTVTNDSVIGDSINRKDEYFFGVGSGKSDCKLTTGQTENNLFFVNSSMSRAHNSRQNLVLINTGVFDMSSVDTAIANLTVIKGTLRYPDGSQGEGKVLTSDANGNASWQTPTVSGATGSEPATPYPGQFYLDTTLAKMKFWNGTTWALITSAP